MKTVFISWSGGQSHAIAKSIKLWLETYMQRLKVFLSSEDIDVGKVWASEVATSLFESDFGLIVVTESNLNSEWLMFEAGALSKNINKARVCPLLCGVSIDSVPSPLRQFQCISLTSTSGDFPKKLLYSLNSSLGQDSLPDSIIERICEENSEDLAKSIGESWEEDTELANLLMEAAIPFMPSFPMARMLSTRNLLYILHSLVYNSHKEIARKYIPSRRNPDGSYAEPLVRYDEQTGNLLFLTDSKVHDIPNYYDLSWGALNSDRDLMHMIFHLQSKCWFSPDHLSQFLDLIDALCMKFLGKQAEYVFLSGKKIEWPAEAYRGAKSSSARESK